MLSIDQDVAFSRSAHAPASDEMPVSLLCAGPSQACATRILWYYASIVWPASFDEDPHQASGDLDDLLLSMFLLWLPCVRLMYATPSPEVMGSVVDGSR